MYSISGWNYASSFFLGGLLLGIFLSIMGQMLITSLYRMLDKKKLNTRDDWIFLLVFFLLCVFVVVFFLIMRNIWYW